MATNYSYERLGPELQKLWDTMKIIRDAGTLHRVAEKIKKHQAVYERVQKDTGIPWQMVAVIHLREAGESDIGVWKGVLHNGQKIVGTGRKTTIVPKGKGPFKTWHEAAVGALNDKKKEIWGTSTNWTPARMLWALEPYNGYGYRNKGLRSPYLWASTNHQQPGKYVADHVFDPGVMDTQVGCAAQLRFLGVGAKNPAATGALVAGVLTAGAVGTVAVAEAPINWWPWIMAGIVGAGVIWMVVSIVKSRHPADEPDIVLPPTEATKKEVF